MHRLHQPKTECSIYYIMLRHVVNFKRAFKYFCFLSRSFPSFSHSQYGTDTSEIWSMDSTCRRFNKVRPFGRRPMKWDGSSTSTPTFLPLISTKASIIYPFFVRYSSTRLKPIDVNSETTSFWSDGDLVSADEKDCLHFSRRECGSPSFDFSLVCHRCHCYNWLKALSTNSFWRLRSSCLNAELKNGAVSI